MAGGQSSCEAQSCMRMPATYAEVFQFLCFSSGRCSHQAERGACCPEEGATSRAGSRACVAPPNRSDLHAPTADSPRAVKVPKGERRAQHAVLGRLKVLAQQHVLRTRRHDGTEGSLKKQDPHFEAQTPAPYSMWCPKRRQDGKSKASTPQRAKSLTSFRVFTQKMRPRGLSGGLQDRPEVKASDVLFLLSK